MYFLKDLAFYRSYFGNCFLFRHLRRTMARLLAKPKKSYAHKSKLRKFNKRSFK